MTDAPEEAVSNIVAINFKRRDKFQVKVTPGVNDPWTIEQREKFDKLYAEYLSVTAKLTRGSEGRDDPDGYIDRLVDRQCDLLWQIIRSIAINDRQINYKFAILRDLMSVPGGWRDGRQLAMLESIRNECLDVGETA